MPPCRAKKKPKTERTVSNTDGAQQHHHHNHHHVRDLLPVWYFDPTLSALYSFAHWKNLLCDKGIADLRKLPSQGLDAVQHSATLVIVQENSATAGSLTVHGARLITDKFILRCLQKKEDWKSINIEQYEWAAPVVSTASSSITSSSSSSSSSSFASFSPRREEKYCDDEEDEPLRIGSSSSSSNANGTAAPASGLMADPPPPAEEVRKMSSTFWSQASGHSSLSRTAADEGDLKHNFDKPLARAEDLELGDVTGDGLHEWVMTEKFDGFRYIWDRPGGRQEGIGEMGFSTQYGNQNWSAACFLMEGMLPSDVPLDGEIWAGRMNFDRVPTMTRSNNPEYRRSLKYVIHDTRHNPSSRYSDRLDLVREALRRLGADRSRVDVVEAVPCACDGACLGALAARDGERVAACAGFHAGRPGCPAEFLNRVVAAGGEGIVLRRNSVDVGWRAGKHKDVLKVKLRYDHEAVVVGPKPGGEDSLVIRTINQPGPVTRCDCRCGNYQLCYKERRRCSCAPGAQHLINVPWLRSNRKVGMPRGVEEATARGWQQVENKSNFFIPKPGSVVTYQYQRGISTGHPRFPNFTRLHEPDCDCAACQLAARMVAMAEETAAAQEQQEQQEEEGGGFFPFSLVPSPSFSSSSSSSSSSSP